MMCIQVRSGGYFIPYLSRVKKDMKPGMIKKLINILEEQIPGVALVWMRKEESYLPPPVPPLLTFMVEKELEIIYSPIACWHWMQTLEKRSGIFRMFIMMFGTEIFLLLRH